MKILMLLRHAKSAWDDAGLDDRDRPLADRGIATAPLVGRMMVERDWLPDLVLCSDAARARQTLGLVMDQWPMPIPTAQESGLYLAGVDGVAEVIRRRGGTAETLLVVGHNPDLERLALTLDPNDSPDRRRLAAKMPTAALARFVISIDDWPELEPGVTTARLTDFVTPKDLVRREQR